MNTLGVILLIAKPGGGTVAVKFRSAEDAHTWAETHPVVAVECVPLVGRAEVSSWQAA